MLAHFTDLSAGYAIAAALILWSLIGYGLGPCFVGFVSDFSMNSYLLTSDIFANLTPQLCNAKGANLRIDEAKVCA